MTKKTTTISTLALATGLALSLTACSGGDGNSGDTKQQIMIMGAGSSFIYPAMSRWANAYYDKTGVQVNYQPIGSGGGQRQIFERTVDFAASDQPLTNAQLESNHLIQFPAIIGGIVMVVNLPNIQANQLTLDGETLANIYLGNIKEWNDPAIAKLNPSIRLPNLPIITVHRADGSGTTFNFTQYLGLMSPQWIKEVGVDSAVNWKDGLGAKGNQGVAAQVQQVSGAIGYVEYAYAKETNMITTKLVNKVGNAVAPTLSSFEAAAKYANYSSDNNYNLILNNQAGAETWPIVATTFVLLPIDGDVEKTQQIKAFFEFAYGNQGQAIAEKLDYVGIPQNVVTSVTNYWNAAK